MPQYELNLKDYVRIFRKRKASVISIFIATVLASLVYISMQKPLYQSAVTIKIEQRKTVAGLLTEWIIYNPGNLMESHLKMITDFSILKKAGLRVGLIDEKTAPEKVDAIVERLRSMIVVERIGQTNMIKLGVIGHSAQEAMDVANSLAAVYSEENLADKAMQFGQARQFIEEQLNSLEGRIRTLEEKLKLEEDKTNGTQYADSLKQKLVTLELDLFDVSQKFTEQYPQVSQLKEQIKDLRSQIRGLSKQELVQMRLSREVEINKKLYSMLKEKLEETRITEAQRVSDIVIVNPAVLPQGPIAGNQPLMILTGIIMGLILGISFAFILESLDASISTIEDLENVIKLKVLGMIPSIQSDFRNKKSIPRKIRDMIFRPPRDGEDARVLALITCYKPRSPSAEAYRNIQTNLQINGSKKTILITSAGPREGKSTIVSNLGIVMAQSGAKTLLVSSDLRRPVVSQNFGLSRSPGLNEYIMGTVSLESIIRNMTDIMMGGLAFDNITNMPGIENIHILPSGELPENPVELLKSSKTRDLIEQMKKEFDVIIFDSPPVLPVTDASILASHMDAVVLVYEIGRTSREALVRTKVQLESVGAKISGVILNHTKSQVAAMSMYPYHPYSYAYYEEEKPREKKAILR